MKAKLLGLAAGAALLAGSALPASAAVISIDPIPLNGVVAIPFTTTGPGTFSNQYTFTLSQSAELTGAAITYQASVKSGSTGGLSNAMFDLYSGDPLGAHTLLTTGTISASGSKIISMEIADTLLALGSYYIDASVKFAPSNTTNAVLGVNGSVSVSAVPEASTWAMMALGFAALGFAGYRSRRSADIAA